VKAAYIYIYIYYIQSFYSIILFIKTNSTTVCCVDFIVTTFVHHLPDVFFIQSGSQLRNNTAKAIHPRGTETYR